MDPGTQATFLTICLFFQALLLCLQTFLFRQDFPKVTAGFHSSNLASLGERLPFPQEFHWKSQISSQVTLILIGRAHCVCLRIRPGPKRTANNWRGMGEGWIRGLGRQNPRNTDYSASQTPQAGLSLLLSWIVSHDSPWNKHSGKW